MKLERPNLSQVDEQVVAYIEALEQELHLRSNRTRVTTTEAEELPVDNTPLEPNEPPTTINLITLSAHGMIKRTPRHHFSRQRRGGMGIFDLETRGDDNPISLALADESQTMLIFTNRAHVFRLPVNKLPESPIRSRGEALSDRFSFESGEMPVAVLADQASGYIALASANGLVRCLRHHLFGEHLRPNAAMIDTHEGGDLVSVCWTPGNADLFILTQKGQAIRFAEKNLSPRGDAAIRLSAGDRVTAVASITDEDNLLICSADGKGTVRQMQGFAANKSSGGGGKIAIKSDRTIGAAAVTPDDDIFLITRVGKLIRFKALEVPITEGVVQGVLCMAMRADEVTAMIISPARQ